MTIAEMLVQETGRLGVVRDAEGNYCFTREQAVNEAREIVAAVYGPPCSARWTPAGPAYSELGIACTVCGWPRSMHEKEKL